MAVISAISDNIELLQHPLVEALIRLKWVKLRAFFFLLIAAHFCFVISLSTYTLLLVHQYPKNVTDLNSSTLTTVTEPQKNEENLYSENEVSATEI